jgi:hypothetical protein
LSKYFQAVRSEVYPTTVVPTDEQYKTEVKRVEKPPKEETVEQTLKRNRFAKK